MCTLGDGQVRPSPYIINSLVPSATMAANPAVFGVSTNITSCTTVAALHFFVIRYVPEIGFLCASWFQLTHLFSMVVFGCKEVKEF